MHVGCSAILAVSLLTAAGSLWAGEQWFYLFLPADNSEQQGFARITNLSSGSGTVSIDATDDTGVAGAGTVTVQLAAGASVQFNSQDIESGNTSKGLNGSIGDGSGNWRLRISSDLQLEVAGLFRNSSGFVNLLHATAPSGSDLSHDVNFFNPASNTNQVSRLRIVNISDVDNNITISGIDDSGNSAGPISLSVGALQAMEISASELENGAPDRGLEGSLGDGSGKWRFTVTSSQAAKVMSLLEDPNGYLSNLSGYAEIDSGNYLINSMPAVDSEQQGFVRLTNPNAEAAQITVNGLDDAGNSASLNVTLAAQASLQFNSDDLESGNASKGLEGAFGDGSGDWRLLISADQSIRVQGLFRTDLGFVNLIHDNANSSASTSHDIAFFNPGSNTNQVSWLRLNNPQSGSNSFTVSAVDDSGVAGAANYELTLGGQESIRVSSQDLESQAFGDGSGKWRLAVSSTAPSYAQSLLFAPDGYLSNLSDRLTINASNGGNTSVEQPNILLIVSDDQGLDSSADYNFTRDPPTTPTISELASAGLVFENAWAAPACAPTRAAILTGKHGVNNGVSSVPGDLAASETIIHEYLAGDSNSQNYASALIGKWHLGGGNASNTDPIDKGVPYFAGIVDGNVEDYNNWELVEQTAGGMPAVSTRTDYNTSVLTDLAETWISQQTSPWFLMLSYNAPHGPFHWPDENLHTRTGQTVASCAEAAAASGASETKRECFLAMIEAMDTEIGNLLSSMSQTERDNTLVIYVGDNGSASSARDQTLLARGEAKGSLHEGGLRVPLIVSGAGVTRTGERESRLVAVTDIFATIAELAGVQISTINDSISFSGYLSSISGAARNYSYSDYTSSSVDGWSVRDGNFQLIHDSGTNTLYQLENGTFNRTDVTNFEVEKLQELLEEAARVRAAVGDVTL